MTDDERFETIMAACREQFAQGHPLAPHLFGIWDEGLPEDAGQRRYRTGDGYMLCPLGALLLGQPAGQSCHWDAALRLEVPLEWIAGFIAAIDRCGSPAGRGPEFLAGWQQGTQVSAALKRAGMLGSGEE